jgi:carnitine O-acetyltransferase
VVDSASGKGRLLSTKELENQLQHIIEKTKETVPAIRNLTASGRDSWADDYILLASISEKNKEVLLDIHAAVFVLCIDDVSPETSKAPSKGPSGNGTTESTVSGSNPVSFSQWLWHGGPPGEKNQLDNGFVSVHI